MSSYQIYEDIKTRTGGDIYLGVVGPVRTGKSTFITNFVGKMVLPNILDAHDKTRTIDELPQSADGKTIMTTQPRFVPKEGVKICVGGKVNLKVRLVDCVGYSVAGAEGLEENGKHRLVKTPWSANPLPFEEAAEIGTKRVITEHSTVAVLVSTDGSFGELDRTAYQQAEEKTARELKQTGKPFVVVLNTLVPDDKKTISLCQDLSKKYEVPVLPVDVANLKEQNIEDIFACILNEFPLSSLRVSMPKWLSCLDFENELIQEIVSQAKLFVADNAKVGDLNSIANIFAESENFAPTGLSNVNMGEGIAYVDVVPKDGLFYKVLSNECGEDISDDFALINYLKSFSHAKVEYEKLKTALEEVEQTGYGVVAPSMNEMTLEDPEIVKQGSKYGVRLKASAPSLHIMKVDVQTEISPIVGSEQQSEDLVKYLLSEFENNPSGLWETNMFGKSLHSLVNEGLNKKIVQMPPEAQKKMRKTLSRIVNEGKGGIICILL